MSPPLLDGLAASTVHLPPTCQGSVLEALCLLFPAIDAATWRGRFRRGRVLDAQGQPVSADVAARPGMRLHYYREVVAEPEVAGQAVVLHQDAHLLVVDKPAGLPVVPAGGYVRQTLLARLILLTGNPQLAPLHRLDRLTRGVMLFSTCPQSRAAYQALFRERRIDKRYEALAPPLPQWDFPLVRRSRIERGEPFFRMAEVAGGANSETRIEWLGQYADHWHYRLQPVTGRKHQLRLHMAGLGAPILHDPLYPQLREPAAVDAPMLALLARQLRFIDPLDGRERLFESAQRLRSP